MTSMTREEEINTLARKYFDNFIQDVCRICGYDDSIKGYINLSQVWHDASERPVKMGDILLIGEQDYASVCFFGSALDNPDKWEKYVKDESLTQWAYISDLLPKGDKK